jgi:putative membrane protein
MRTHNLVLTTGLAAALAMAGCTKPNPAPAANDQVTTANPAVTGAQDATAGAVGAVAATAGATTTAGFVTGAAVSDMYEIAAAQIARQKSTTPAIKTFAAKMVHDHSASTAALKKILASGAANATAPTAMDARRQGLVDNLNKAAPGDFDKTYVDQQVAAHDEALTLFKGFADHGDNDALKAFAAQTAPTIQSHLDMAKQMSGDTK